MKRLVVLALVLMIVAAGFATPVAKAADEVTITYALWEPSQLPAHQEIAAAFEKENPGVKVDIQVIPWANYWDKLQTAVAGGSAFDVFWINKPNFPVYASKGVLADLTDLVKQDKIDMGNYPDSLVKMYTYDEHIYGLPKDFDTIALYYNKTLFDKAGVKYPDDKWTWDDLKDAAKKLTTKDQWGFLSTTADQIGYWNFIFANGGQVLNEDGTKALLGEQASCDAIKYLYSFVEEKLSPDGATQLATDPWTQLFPGGKGAMVLGGSWIARTYAEADKNIDVAPIPMSPATGKRASIIHGLANVMWSKTQHPKEAFALLKFLGSDKAAEILAATGTVIPAYKGYTDKWVKAIPSMHLQTFIDALDYAVPYPSASKGMEWNFQVAAVLTDVWSGNAKIDDACTLAADKANEILSED